MLQHGRNDGQQATGTKAKQLTEFLPSPVASSKPSFSKSENDPKGAFLFGKTEVSGATPGLHKGGSIAIELCFQLLILFCETGNTVPGKCVPKNICSTYFKLIFGHTAGSF
jgi:hypothetical protein